MTTYDRYVLLRFLHVFAVFFLAAIGLFAVIDGFTNLDAFQQKTREEGALALFLLMGQHYFYQSALLIDLVGPTIIVLSSMCVLIIMLRAGEIHPVLAAGVPTYRIAVPLVIGVLMMVGLLTLNQEFLLPRIAHHLQGQHGDTATDAQEVQAQFDPKWWIYVSASEAFPAEQRVSQPEFQLPLQTLVTEITNIRGENAFYVPGEGAAESGWVVKNVSCNLKQLKLTPEGKQVVVPQPNGTDVFIACPLTFDQLTKRASNQRLIGSPELIRRLQQPASSLISRRSLLVHLHSRFTRPVLSLIGVFVVVPLIIRKERMSQMQQVTNIATCMAVLGIVFGIVTGCEFLGQSGLIDPLQAVWSPLILGGSIAGWLTGTVRT